MLDAPLPATEAQRLRSVFGLKLLDTAPEERFDRITRMAARLFGVPIALFSVIDAERQWFKSRIGLAFAETPRHESICAQTILQDDVLVIPDTGKDARFATLPLVTGPPHVRFYAGAPVRSPDRAKIGTLCLLDIRPRRFDAVQRAQLFDLAAILESELAAGMLQRALRNQQQNELSMTGLLNKVPEGIVLLDTRGQVLSANPAAEQLFRTVPRGLAGRAAGELLAADIAPLVEQVRAGHGSQLQATGRRLDGETFAAEFSVNTVQLAGGQGYAVIVRDISPRRENERRDRATDERRRKYFVTATHELRTPMASVVGFTELLLKRDFNAESVREFIGIIHTQATRLVALINEMLDLARIESGGVAAFDIGPHDAVALVQRTIAALDGLDDGDNVRVDAPDGLPPVLADAAKLQQALLNLLGNAIKYSKPGAAISVTLRPAMLGERPAISFAVRDQGMGMTPEQLARVFDAFYRADAKGSVVGSGLGLTIVKEITELQGGTVQLESTPGAGTEATLTLPAAS